MANTYTQIHLQFVFAVKYRDGLIHSSFKDELYQYIAGIIKNHNHKLLAINGMPDHVHVLFLQNPQKTITDIVKQIKGSSSHFMNRGEFILEKFAWQTGYAAYSVSASVVEKVVEYIRNQKTHHQKKTFSQEYEEFLLAYGLDKHH